MPTTETYLNMRNSGSSPKQIYLALKADGASEINSIRILRELFQLSLMEAKEVVLTTDTSVNSLAEYQEKIFPTIVKAIEMTDRGDADPGGTDGVHVAKNVFEVAKVTPVLPDIWLVEGHAYKNVHVGDTVAIQVSSALESTEVLHFKVIAATTYGELVPELDEGLTGGLTLEGKHREYGKQIHKAHFLAADVEE